MTKAHEKILAKMCRDYGLEVDMVDLKALWNDGITPQENFDKIEQNLKLAGMMTDEKIAKEYQEDEVEAQEQMMLEEERKHIQAQIRKEFQELMKKETSDLKVYFFSLEKYIETVMKAKHIHGLFITGRAGLGKSYTTVKTLSRAKKDFKIILGNISPLELYHTLYNYRDGILCFDDTQSLLANKPAISLILSAMWNPTNHRVVSWLTTSKKLKAPEQFEFKGKIIFICNEIPKLIEATVSRCMTYELKFRYHDILKIMLEIAKQKHNILTKDERIMIWKWLRDNTDEVTENFDLRLQKKVETLYIYNKDCWQELAKKLIRRDRELALVKQLMESKKLVKTQIKKWREETGQEGRKFFYLKKKILSLGEIDKAR